MWMYCHKAFTMFWKVLLPLVTLEFWNIGKLAAALRLLLGLVWVWKLCLGFARVIRLYVVLMQTLSYMCAV
jgi:hypothetical protein